MRPISSSRWKRFALQFATSRLPFGRLMLMMFLSMVHSRHDDVQVGFRKIWARRSVDDFLGQAVLLISSFVAASLQEYSSQFGWFQSNAICTTAQDLLGSAGLRSEITWQGTKRLHRLTHVSIFKLLLVWLLAQTS